MAFERFSADYVGLCYDSGHGNLEARGLDDLERHKDRLISLHLHDNDGSSDQHKLPFTGTVDWKRLSGIIAASSYPKCMSFETTMRNMGTEDEAEFLAAAFEAGTRLADMVERNRRPRSGGGGPFET